MAYHDSTFTICEDQPRRSRWDVEIRTFATLAKAKAHLRNSYTEDERGRTNPDCRAYIRHDASGEAI